MAAVEAAESLQQLPPAPEVSAAPPLHSRTTAKAPTFLSVLDSDFKPNPSWLNRLRVLFGASRPDCLNGGTPAGESRCSCPPHFSGKLCQVVECAHNGTVLPSRDGCKCADERHFSGRFCQNVICENGGTPTARGRCICPPHWYSGRFCEHYSSPWGTIFACGGGALLLLFFVYVLCSYGRATARQRRARRSRRAAEGNERPFTISQSRARRSRHSGGGGERRRRASSADQAGQLVVNMPAAMEQLVPPPGYDVVGAPPGVEPVDDKPPPPSYEEVVFESHRFPSVPPSSSAAVGRQTSVQEQHRLVQITGRSASVNR